MLELKPYTELKKPHELPNESFRPSNGIRFTEVDPPDLSRYNSYHRQGGSYSNDIKKNDFTLHSNHNYNNNFNNDNHNYNHQLSNGYLYYKNNPIYGTRLTETATTKQKKSGQINGLKNYATYPYHRIANRNSFPKHRQRHDYNSYFAPVAAATKSFANAFDEQAKASWSLIANMLKQNKIGFAIPTYASSNKNYFL